MSKVRVYDIARDLNVDHDQLVALLQELGFDDVRNRMSKVDAEAVDRVRRHLESHDKPPEVVEERLSATVVKRKRVGVPKRASSATPVVATVASTKKTTTKATKAAATSDDAPQATKPATTRRKSTAKEKAEKEAASSVEPTAVSDAAQAVGEPAVAQEAVSTEFMEPPVDTPAVVSSIATQPADTTEVQPVADTSQEPTIDTSAQQPAVVEPHAPLADVTEDGQSAVDVSTSTQEQTEQTAAKGGVATTPTVTSERADDSRVTSPLWSDIAPDTPSTVSAKPVSGAQPDDSVAPVTESDEAPPGGQMLSGESGSERASDDQHVDDRNKSQSSTQGRSDDSDVHEGFATVSKPVVDAITPTRVRPLGPVPIAVPVTQPPVRVQQQRTGTEVWDQETGVTVRHPSPTGRTSQTRGGSGSNKRREVVIVPKAQEGARPDGRTASGVRKGGGWTSSTKGRRFAPAAPPKKAAAPSTKEMSEHKKNIKIEAQVTVQTLANKMSLKATELLVKLMSMGMHSVHLNSTLDADTAKLVASEFGWEVEDVAVSEEEALHMARDDEEENDALLESRPPIVTVMGHVDHGKTSLLDQIRKTNVASSEAGGITQHIGAYRVSTSRGFITFLDTPGHAAFTQMRSRGARVTDIVILVVAADDGVMPQTKEAANHAKAAKVPIIVAINKIDKDGANPDKIRREMAELELIPEEWGGSTIFCEVSAKTREGLDALLEMTALQAELLELKANPKKPAIGTVVEALLDRGKGPVARVVITDGTLRAGDVVLAGVAWGKVRAMTDDRGRQVRAAGPSQPVEILGLSEVPSAGDPIHVVKSVKIAQELASQRKTRASNSLIPASAKVSLEELTKRIAEAEQLELRIVIKADVHGSVEAVADALAGLSTDKIRVAIIHAGVGGITEGDINLAVAAKAIVVGFNVRPAGKAAQLAETEGIEIRLYSVIYDAIDDITKAMLGRIGPTFEEKLLGKAEVRQTFHIAKTGTIAGCFVQEGTIRRNAKLRLVRDSVQIYEGRFGSLKRFKDDAREVDKGFECGISIDGYNDIKVGDIVECFEIAEIQATL